MTASKEPAEVNNSMNGGDNYGSYWSVVEESALPLHNLW